MDTNIFLARYAPGEKEYQDSKKLIEATETGKLSAVTSTLTLVEIASAVRRTPGKSQGKASPDVAGSFVRRALSMRNLSYVPLGGEMALVSEGKEARIPLSLFSSCSRGQRFPATRTSTLLH